MPHDQPLTGGRLLIYRHGPLVRAAHWINLLSMGVLLLSGLQILCSHPALYWGETAHFARPAAGITSDIGPDGEPHGHLRALGLSLDTTGVLGASRGADGQMAARAFPSWLTLPGDLDLGAGRRWHFFFAWLFVANGLVYLASGLITRRFGRDLMPRRAELTHIGRTLADHARLRFARGGKARGYNVVQKLAYLPVIFVLLPLMALTGMAMSPAIDARVHLLAAALGGRQSARTLHFLSAAGLLIFALAHVAMVILAGPLNEVRSMVTGWFVIKPEEKDA